MPNRPKLWATGLLMAVFAAGVALGGGATALADSDRGSDSRRSRGQSYTEHLTTELELAAWQSDFVAEVVDERRPGLHKLWEEFRPRYDSIIAHTRAQIMTILSEEQKESYRAHNSRVDSIRAERYREKHERK